MEFLDIPTGHSYLYMNRELNFKDLEFKKLI